MKSTPKKWSWRRWARDRSRTWSRFRSLSRTDRSCSPGDIRLGYPPGRSEALLYQRPGLTLIDLSTRLASRGDTMKHIACLILLTSLFTLNAFADDDKDHHHHEDLTAAQLGTVTFPVSCAPSVQKPFERGVALLHSFWYEEAEQEFQQIAKDDPHCAMAHWGIAMSPWHQLSTEPPSTQIPPALDNVTPP